jgi:RNA polymerase sigma-70 factor (ECF subfamily)
VEDGTLEAAMARVAQGDERAFASVYEGLAGRLRRLFQRLTRDASLAEDLVQETLLRVHRARATYVLGAPVVPWAYAIGRRLLIDHVRRATRERTGILRTEPLVSRAETPEELVEAQELLELAHAALADLPPRQARMFRMVRAEEQSLAEAAERMGITSTAVKVGVCRAGRFLRGAIAA